LSWPLKRWPPQNINTRQIDGPISKSFISLLSLDNLGKFHPSVSFAFICDHGKDKQKLTFRHQSLL
jgi:hypothetical protein